MPEFERCVDCNGLAVVEEIMIGGVPSLMRTTAHEASCPRVTGVTG